MMILSRTLRAPLGQKGSAAKAALPLRRGSGAGEFGDVPGARTPRARNMIGVIPHHSPIVRTLSAVGLRYASAARRERLALASRVARVAIEQTVQLQRPPMVAPPVPRGTLSLQGLGCKDKEDFPRVVWLPPDRKIRESQDSYPRIRAQT